MAKRTVRIPLYKNQPDKFVRLLQKVVEHHEELGASSPLNDPSIVDMADFKLKLTEAVQLRTEAEELRGLAKSKLAQADVILGIKRGQNIHMQGTLYNMLDIVKQFLKARFYGIEKQLLLFGFHVVIDTAIGIGRKRKTGTGK